MRTTCFIHTLYTCNVGDCLQLFVGTTIAAVLECLPKVIEGLVLGDANNSFKSTSKMRIGRQASFLQHPDNLGQRVVPDHLIGYGKRGEACLC